MVVLRDQPYAERGNGTLSYDLVMPDSAEPLPLVVFVHGGGWISGDRSMYHEEAGWLAPQGFACACIDYRLAPLHPFPAAVQDTQAFVRFARSEADRFGIVPDRIYAMGNSAGGHLACMLGMCADTFGVESHGVSHLVNGVIDVCGITDMTNPRVDHFPIAMDFLDQFIGVPHYVDPIRWGEASPIWYLDSAQCPYLILHGTHDEIVPLEQSTGLYEGLTAHGVPAKFVPVPDEEHNFTVDGWSLIREEYVAFLRGLST